MHLRDDRKLIGVLRSYDQYGQSLSLPLFSEVIEQTRLTTPFLGGVANLVLTQTIERLFHPPSRSYAQTDRGVFLIRGENVVLLGEIVSSLSPRGSGDDQDPG